MRLLLIEDHHLMGRALERALAEEGHTIDIAGSPATGLDFIQTAIYDVVMIDLVRCREQNLALLRRWRLASPQIPLLALIAPDSASVSLARSLRADGCVTVPFAVDELHACLRIVAPARKTVGPQRVHRS